jgi:hypothetical protein
MSAEPPAEPGFLETWKLVIIVDPNAKLAGSTSVACWVVEFVNVSELNFTKGVVAGGKFEPEPLPLFDGKNEPEPGLQLKLAAIMPITEKHPAKDFTASPLFRRRPDLWRPFHQATGCSGLRQCRFAYTGC